jgi:hypothetical protein
VMWRRYAKSSESLYIAVEVNIKNRT